MIARHLAKNIINQLLTNSNFSYILQSNSLCIMKSLLDLKEGEFAFVVDFTASENIEQLLELGIFPGEKIIMKCNSAKKNYILVQLNKVLLSIPKQKAETIITNYISFEFCLN